MSSLHFTERLSPPRASFLFFNFFLGKFSNIFKRRENSIIDCLIPITSFKSYTHFANFGSSHYLPPSPLSILKHIPDLILFHPYILQYESFFFFFKYFFAYLFRAVFGPCFCMRAFSSCGKWGPLFIAARGPLTVTTSCCGAQAPDAQAEQLWLTGPAAPRHVGSSQTRARTRVPCIGRQTLSHRATREAPSV